MPARSRQPSLGAWAIGICTAAARQRERWVHRLDDMEKLFFMIVFILILFMLILVRAGRRKVSPAPGRSFVSSVVLVMLFSFAAGWMMDSRFEMQEVLNFF